MLVNTPRSLSIGAGKSGPRGSHAHQNRSFRTIGLALAFAPIAATAQEQSKGFALEDGTPIKLVLSENLSSASAHTGDLVAFETVVDVKVQGVVVIPRGSNAWATITDSQHKRRLGRAGHLDLNIDKVRLADGEKVLLRAIAGGSGGGHQGAMIGAMVATSIVTFGGAALFLLLCTAKT